MTGAAAGSDREAFLAGERPGDVAIFLADDHLRNAEALEDRGERVEGGYVLVLAGERGRRVFPTVAGEDPMAFARQATAREGTVDRDLTGGTCPDAGHGEGADHALRFVLAFAQERTEGVGGPYEAGDVVHAYAQCACGTAYSDRWVVSGDADG